MNLSQYKHHVVLRNGSSLILRAIRPDDKQHLLDGFHHLTEKSIYSRFLTAKRELTEKELKYLTEIDYDHHVAIVATVIDKMKEEIIGVGRYIDLSDKRLSQVAEVAFTVDDEHQGLGVGTILFEQIVIIAKKNGILRLVADVLCDNKKMIEIFNHSGYKLKKIVSSGVVHFEFSIVDQE